MSSLNLTQAGTHPPPDLSMELHVVDVDSDGGMVTPKPHSPSGGEGCGAASSGGNGATSLLESLLDFDYRLGLMPFRLSKSTTGVSDCIVKIVFTFVNLCSLLHIVLQIRLFAVILDNGDKKGNTYWFMAIGHQISVMMLHLRYAYTLLRKQARFVNLAALLRSTSLRQHWHFKKTGKISRIVRLLSLASCTLTVFGGFHVIKKGEQWSFTRILEDHEAEVFLAVEPLVPQIDNSRNETTAAGLLFHNPDLETLILGGTGIALEYLHQILNSCTHDFFMVSTISLWLYMKGVRGELKVAQTHQADYTTAQCQALVDAHEELRKISKHVNEILKLFLPALTLTGIIMASYFTHICFHREWRIAVPYAFKLGKIGFTYMLAMEISDYEDNFNQWYISQELPGRLGLEVISVQLKLSEMRQHQVGIGKGIFYIDTRFICSFAGITSSYFFIVTEAWAEKGTWYFLQIFSVRIQKSRSRLCIKMQSRRPLLNLMPKFLLVALCAFLLLLLFIQLSAAETQQEKLQRIQDHKNGKG